MLAYRNGHIGALRAGLPLDLNPGMPPRTQAIRAYYQVNLHMTPSSISLWTNASNQPVYMAFRIKDMGSKQLEEASGHAQAGKGTIKQGDIKLAGDDHQVSVQKSFEEQAEDLMEAALQKLRRTLAHQETKGTFPSPLLLL